MFFHVFRRGSDRRTRFEDEADYAPFLRLFGQTQEAAPMRVPAYCVPSNHGHPALFLFQLQPSEGNATGRFWTTDLAVEYVRLNADYHT